MAAAFAAAALPRSLLRAHVSRPVVLVSTSSFFSLSEAVVLLINNCGFKYEISREMWLRFTSRGFTACELAWAGLV